MKRLRKLNRFFGYLSLCGAPLAAVAISAGACGEPFSNCEAHRSCPTGKGGAGGEGDSPGERGGTGATGGTDSAPKGGNANAAGTGTDPGGSTSAGGAGGSSDTGAGAGAGDQGQGDCAPGEKLCGAGNCVPEDGCCVESDCSDTCQTCSEGSCVAIESADDPDSCAGTCDAKGVCKSAQGQDCKTGDGCISGTTCAPDGVCCDTACTNSCEACDVKGFEGICTPVASGKPHGNRAACEGDEASCAGSCTGREDGQCTFPTRACGAASACAGSNVIGASACAEGSCVAPAAAVCDGGFVCTGSACKTACTTDSDCVADHFCQGGTCHLDAKQVAIGLRTVCVLLVDGTARCWGGGELGNGTTGSSSTPVKVKNLTNATSISGDFYQFCAVATDGSVRCWGNALIGSASFTEPTPLSGITQAKAVDVGTFHACAVLSGGTAVCWGYNSNGMLGDGSMTNSAAPVPVKDLPSVTAVAAGGSFTCAIAGAGVRCWGDNALGQLANGATTASPTPVFTLVGNGPVALASSRGGTGGHSCAILTSNSVQCWGYNYDGQLGNGQRTATPSVATSTPVAVSGLTGVTSLALGSDHSCALLDGGGVKCWGYNSDGELGNGSTTSSLVPVPVSTLGTGVKQLAAGANATCAVLNNGSVKCWGLAAHLGISVNALTPQIAPEW